MKKHPIRKALIKLETNAHIPLRMRCILRDMRDRHNFTCKYCGRLVNTYSPEEWAMLDPNNEKYWGFCYCDPATWRWKKVSKDTYWATRDSWIHLWGKNVKVISGTPKGEFIHGYFDGDKPVQPIVKLVKDGVNWKYYMYNRFGWR